MFDANIKKLQENYPEAYNDLLERHPSLSAKIEQQRRLSLLMDRSIASATPEQEAASNALIRRFNALASETNNTIESDFDPELHAVVEESAKALYDALFPESAVSIAVRFYTGQKTLEDYQKWLIAPGEGIESFMRSFGSLLDPDTWSNALAGGKTLLSMSSEERNLAFKALQRAWEEIPPKDRARGIFSWCYAAVSLFGGVARLSRSLSLSPAIIDAVAIGARIVSTAPKLRSLPAGVVAGIFLEPIEGI